MSQPWDSSSGSDQQDSTQQNWTGGQQDSSSQGSASSGIGQQGSVQPAQGHDQGQQYGQPQYGQQSYGQQGSGQQPYGQHDQQQYDQQQYGQPQYGQHDQQQYGQSPYGQQPYGQPQYPGQYGAPTAAKRPGSVTAAAVLAFVQAGLVTIGAIVALAGGSVLADDRINSDELDSVGTLLTIMAVIGFIGAALLIIGGTKAMGGTSAFLVAGGFFGVGLSIAWLIWFMTQTELGFGQALIWPLVYVILPVIALGLSFSGTAATWFRSKKTA